MVQLRKTFETIFMATACLFPSQMERMKGSITYTEKSTSKKDSLQPLS
jgi:hypothetical protein